MTESDLRDELTERLSLLEPGLSFIDKEHHLPNPLGARGFIDILARDRFGNRVIIELKRSNQSARQALHEVLKYVPLFVAHHGLSPHRLRCFIVSTDWHELGVPFAEFLKVANFQAEGFLLRVNEEGIIGAERVVVPDLPEPVRPFHQHAIFVFRDGADRDHAVDDVRRTLETCGAESYAVLLADFEGADPTVMYPHAIYTVPLRVRSEVMEEIEASVQDEYHDADLSPDEMDNLVEDTFQAEVSNRLLHLHNTCGRKFTYEIGHPEKFTRMRYVGWNVSKVVRHGLLESAAAADDEEILQMVSGVEGQSENRFYRMSSPRFSLDWQDLGSASFRCLEGNRTWVVGFQWFCDWVSRESPDAAVSVAVYNPLNLPISLYKLMEHGHPGYMPSMELVGGIDDEKQARMLFGDLVWDGQTVPESVPDVFGDLCGGLDEWFFRTHIGTAWELDAEILRRHGLSYGLNRVEVKDGAVSLARMATTEREGDLVDMVPDNGPHSFEEFLRANEKYLLELRDEIRIAQAGL